jgi:hypothetical protein
MWSQSVDLPVDITKPDLELWEIQKASRHALDKFIEVEQELDNVRGDIFKYNKAYEKYRRIATIELHEEENNKTGAFAGQKAAVTQPIRTAHTEERIDQLVSSKHSIDNFIIERWTLLQKEITLKGKMDFWKQVQKTLHDMSMGEASIHKYGGG